MVTRFSTGWLETGGVRVRAEKCQNQKGFLRRVHYKESALAEPSALLGDPGASRIWGKKTTIIKS